jgi:hypothetical protein
MRVRSGYALGASALVLVALFDVRPRPQGVTLPRAAEVAILDVP